MGLCFLVFSDLLFQELSLKSSLLLLAHHFLLPQRGCLLHLLFDRVALLQILLLVLCPTSLLGLASLVVHCHVVHEGSLLSPALSLGEFTLDFNLPL